MTDENRASGAGQTAEPTLLDHMGGPMGFVYSTIPVVVFVAANAFLSLPWTIGVSIGVALALTGFRLLRGESVASAVSGMFGVVLAAGVVAWTGSAKDFFVIGIWVSLAGFVATFGSVLARRPLTGLVWNLLHGGTHDWRANGSVLRAHDVATLAVAAVCGARFGVVPRARRRADEVGARLHADQDGDDLRLVRIDRGLAILGAALSDVTA